MEGDSLDSALFPRPKADVNSDGEERGWDALQVGRGAKRHFAKVLNIESAYDETVFGSSCSRPVQKELDDLPSQDELVRAIASLQNSKAPGESGILPEMVRHGGPKFLTAFLSLVHRVWREGSVPQAWRDAELIPIPKKGDLSLCDNWRGIALLDVVGKVVGRLIQSRLQHLAELELPESQCKYAHTNVCKRTI